MAAAANRVNWIDWLKAIIVFGVFLYHAAQPFVLTTWLVTDAEQSLVLSALAGAGYLFGMPLMFLLSGAATWLALGRRAMHGYLGLRVRRLLVPLVLGIALLSPLQAYLAAPGGRSPIAAIGDFWTGARVYLDPQWLGDYGYHLWFLGFLFCYSVLAAPAVGWLRAEPARATRIAAPLSRGAIGPWLPLLPLVALQLLVRPLAPAYRDWADFVLWLSYFGLGVLVAADPALVRAIAARRWQVVAVTVGIGVAYLPVASSGGVLDLEHDPGFGPVGLGYVALRTAVGYGLTLAFIGVAAQYLVIRPRLLRWASDAVLPFYVIHHPVLVVVAAWAVTLPVGLWPKFGLIVALGLAGTLVIYEALRRGIAALGRGGRREPDEARHPVPEEVPA